MREKRAVVRVSSSFTFAAGQKDNFFIRRHVPEDWQRVLESVRARPDLLPICGVVFLPCDATKRQLQLEMVTAFVEAVVRLQESTTEKKKVALTCKAGIVAKAANVGERNGEHQGGRNGERLNRAPNVALIILLKLVSNIVGCDSDDPPESAW